ncbi:MAG: xanthine dehydrogenase family protein subunit M [Alphaproteobacteria bacterium]|nr:xanthine dehydrogenase family protein subunit M [Alphaproteobacteria bacterium]
MKPGRFTYHDPTTIDELIGLLGSLDDAKLLAGGQSLMPMLNMRFSQPDHVVDLNGIDELAGITTNGSALKIGAMTRQAALLKSNEIADQIPVMQAALQCVGHFQTRYRGTIGGSLCHLDPSAELPLIALLCDAELQVAGPDGDRSIAMGEWPLAYMMPSISESEILKSININPWPQRHGFAFEEIARRRGDFAIVGVGCQLAIDNGVISKAVIAIGGANQVPYRLTEAEEALVGQPATDDVFAAAGEVARKQDAMSDAYITAAYRQRLANVLTKRTLATAAQRATGE